MAFLTSPITGSGTSKQALPVPSLVTAYDSVITRATRNSAAAACCAFFRSAADVTTGSGDLPIFDATTSLQRSR
jgi:hypothetical protein